MTTFPEAVTALPGAAATAVGWRARRQLQVTVVAKATFAFAPDADMPCVEPQPILHTEVHHGKSPARSIRLTTDLAPYLARADVLFTGHAHAPPGAPAREMAVRLAVFERERERLDKTLVVRDPAGFQRIPMTYEQTYGGFGFVDNPFGTGANLGSAAPNVLDPAQPQLPVCFAPLGRAFPPRKRLLGATARAVLDGDVAEIPDDFDWAYYQAAPPDQRIEHLSGGEWIVLEGLHPTRSGLRTRLPDARGFARVYGLARFGVADGQLLELVADTLRIDGDEERCTVVWRRSFPVYAEEALASLRIVAGVEVAGAALHWPEPSTLQAERPAPRAQPLPNKSTDDATILLSVDLVEDEPEDDNPFAGTMVLAQNPPAAAAPAAVLPFKGGASPLAQPNPSPRHNPSSFKNLSEQTLSEDSGAALTPPVRTLPFGKRKVSNPRLAAVTAPPTVAAAPPPAPAPAPPLAKPLKPTTSEVQWAAPPPPPAAAPRPVPVAPAIPLASPSLKKGLYGRFGR